MKNNIYFDLIVDAKPEKVFDAISQPHHLECWWPLVCSGKPILGSEYNFNFTDEYDWYGVVAYIENGISFHIKMTKSDLDWNSTTFGFELEEREDRKTLIKFFHKDWPELNHHFRFSAFCWAGLLNGLKSYVENGVIVPFENRS